MKGDFMSKQLLILRHGKSDWGVDVCDFNRPLKKRGKRAAQRIGLWLQQQSQVPDYIVSSPAKRARDTAKKICQAIGLKGQQVHDDSRLYAAQLRGLLSVLADSPVNARQVLLVGHNPGLEELLEYLHEGSIQIPDDGKLLATATLATLRMPDNWDSLPIGCAKVVSIIRPNELLSLDNVTDEIKPE
jgi:phosphohistidine phosphatase